LHKYKAENDNKAKHVLHVSKSIMASLFHCATYNNSMMNSRDGADAFEEFRLVNVSLKLKLYNKCTVAFLKQPYSPAVEHCANKTRVGSG